MIGSVSQHSGEWDKQIALGLNSSMNCTSFLEFLFLSREQIRAQLSYLRGNFSQQEYLESTPGQVPLTPPEMLSFMSQAASLVSAQVHIHGVLGAARPDCMSEHLQLLFFMSLRRMKTLLQDQLRHIWAVFQGTPEQLRRSTGRWLDQTVELLDADMRTMESIVEDWHPPASEMRAVAQQEYERVVGTEKEEKARTVLNNILNATFPLRPGPPLPAYSTLAPDGIALSTAEALRREVFEEWDLKKPLLRALLRYVLPRDGHVADVCGRTGKAAEFLNNTGLLTAYAFDPCGDIETLTRGSVQHARLYEGPVQLWRTFDLVMCLSAAGDLQTNEAAWAEMWRNTEAHATQGAIFLCGTRETRAVALAAAMQHAPALQLDEALTRELNDALMGAGEEAGVCIFRRPELVG